MTINKRYIWIDIVRLFSMLMIIAGHIPCYEGRILAYITTFHVPIFFIISRYLYHPQTFRKEVINSFHSLIIPYIILGLINCIYWSVLYAYTNNTPISDNIKIFTDQLLTTKIGLPMIGPLWFLIVLFLLRITMIKAFHKYSIITIFIVGILGAYIIEKIFPDSLLFAAIDYFIALPFFLIGCVIQKNEQLVKRVHKLPTKEKIIIACTLFIISIIIFKYQGGSNMSMHNYGRNIFLFYACAFLCSFGMFTLSLLIKTKSPQITDILHTTNNGLPLMIGLQIIMIDFVKHITHIYKFHITESLILSISIMLAIYPLTLLSMKYFQMIIGKRK